MQRDEETLCLARETLELEKRKEERMTRRETMNILLEETKIMSMDITMMTPHTKAWHKKGKQNHEGCE